MNLDPFCDYAFIPFYTRGRDTLLDDSNPITQQLLGNAQKATRTQYVIHLPHLNISKAMQDMDNNAGRAKMVEYWTTKKVYHYAILDLECKPWLGRMNIGNEVKAVFDMLKKLRKRGEQLKKDHPQTPAPEFGLVILGIRIWPVNSKDFLKEVNNNLQRFQVDGFVPWTHFTEDEFKANYPSCWITGATPYNNSGDNNTNIWGAVQVLDWVNKSTLWNKQLSISVSFSLCTRVYEAAAAEELDNPCKKSNYTIPTTSSDACLYSIFRNIEGFGNDTKLDQKHYTPFTVNKGDIAVYDIAKHIKKKLCWLKVRYTEFELSIALFDLECEDWTGKCDNDGTRTLNGTKRLGEVSTPEAGYEAAASWQAQAVMVLLAGFLVVLLGTFCYLLFILLTDHAMGKAPLFCTFGVHKQDYTKINFDACDYAFIPFYVRGGDTFLDDSNSITYVFDQRGEHVDEDVFRHQRIPEKVYDDIGHKTGSAKIKEYWTSKKIYHYAVFDIGVKENEKSQADVIIGYPFSVLQAFRKHQRDLETSNPIQQPNRGFLVASFNLWPKADDTPPMFFTQNVLKVPLDAIIIVTHLTVDEFEAKLPCVITGGAPYSPGRITNILGMQKIMTRMSQETAWVTRATLAISVSLCSRVYMPARRPDLDQMCVDHMYRPNGTAAYCKLRKEFGDIPFGLALFDLECEDWEGACSKVSTPIPGTTRYTEITDYYPTLSNFTKGSFPC
ncbi:hypothetical protein MTO96_005923 [Rhipicephalus appendiculatus]